MFHAPMARFQLELIYCFIYFSTDVPSNICMFLSCRSFVANTFSTGLVGVEVTSVSIPTRPVENVLATKGLQDRNIKMLYGTTLENKGKTIN